MPRIFGQQRTSRPVNTRKDPVISLDNVIVFVCRRRSPKVTGSDYLVYRHSTKTRMTTSFTSFV